MVRWRERIEGRPGHGSVRRLPNRWLGVLLVFACSTGHGARDEWLALQAPQFTVISQLSEKETRRWAGEFDQFVAALHRLYALENRGLPPLDIVLFERSKGFAPYRPHTESGQADNVEGLFARRANWSVIGVVGSRGSGATRRTIYHEAVHWLFSVNPVEPPLWFAEGIAEVFSTFEIRNGKGRWGEAIPEYVAYLNQFGPRSLETFFGVAQDEALHEDRRYYPQAWAFVHFGLFGDGGSRRRALADFVQRVQTEPRASAFQAAFGMSFEDGDLALRRYLRRGKYGMAEVELEDRGDTFAVAQADPTRVQFVLGRLALVAGSTELALRHADSVIAGAPENPEGYEVRALAQFDSGEREAARQTIDTAVRLGSRDAGLQLLDAELALQEHFREDGWLDQALEPAIARRIADGVTRSLALQPHNSRAFELLALALLNVAELTPQDEQWLAASQRFLPRSGLAALVRAAAANRRGDHAAARRLLAEARAEGRELPTGLGRASAGLGERWLLDELSLALADAYSLADLESVEALLDDAKAGSGGSAGLRQALAVLSQEVAAYRTHLMAVEAAEAGDFAGARAHWQSIADDPDATRSARLNAERALRSLPQ